MQKQEVEKPFPQEAELAKKLERMAEFNALLNRDEKGDDTIGMDDEATEPEKSQEDVKLLDKKGTRSQKCQQSRVILKKRLWVKSEKNVICIE